MSTMSTVSTMNTMNTMSLPTEPHALRVLQVAASYFPHTGGVETHVLEVGQRLARLGAEVTVLTTDLSGDLPESERMDGVWVRRVRAWPRHQDYYFAPGLYHAIRHGAWDVMHCQGAHTLVPPVAMLAARRAGLPYLLSFHTGGDNTRLRRAFRALHWQALRPLLARAERLIGPSEWEVEYFRARLHLPAERFAVIPNGAQHLSQVIERDQPATGGPLIVSVGRLDRYKGHQRVIAALPAIRRQIPDIQLRIVGVGPYESALRRLVSQLGVADRVVIQGVPPGDRAGMAAIIARADVVTLLSEHEAQGIAALEGLALQRPVLVAYTTALRELADRGLVRAVALESTPEEVAAAVIEQIRHPLVPAQVELPTWDACTAELLRIYQDVARGAQREVALSTQRER
jgi:glycosyltransferase involved in cell wall biosynthesis